MNENAISKNLLRSINDLRLSVRSKNWLAAENIITIGDLIVKTEAELNSIKNLGRKSINEIVGELNAIDLALGMIIPGELELNSENNLGESAPVVFPAAVEILEIRHAFPPVIYDKIFEVYCTLADGTIGEFIKTENESGYLRKFDMDIYSDAMIRVNWFVSEFCDDRGIESDSFRSTIIPSYMSLKNISIEEIPFDVRAQKCFKKLGVEFVGFVSDEEFWKEVHSKSSQYIKDV
jgi:hypothetical protein